MFVSGYTSKSIWVRFAHSQRRKIDGKRTHPDEALFFFSATQFFATDSDLKTIKGDLGPYDSAAYYYVVYKYNFPLDLANNSLSSSAAFLPA